MPPFDWYAAGEPSPGYRRSEGGSRLLFVSAQLIVPRLICLRLFVHFMRFAASRIFCTAGSSNPIRIAMIAITTSSSIRVNAGRRGERALVADTEHLRKKG